MKKSFSLALLLSACSWSLVCHGQTENKLNSTYSGLAPFEDGKLCYCGIDSVSGISSDLLHSTAAKWFPLAFNNAKAVIQRDDPAAHEIYGIATIPAHISSTPGSTPDADVRYSITIQTKDGRYRYRFTDITVKSRSSGREFPFDTMMIGNDHLGMFVDLDFQMKKLIKSLGAHMRTAEKEDW